MSTPSQYRPHELSKRLGGEVVENLARRYEAGESARAMATEYGVAASALIRLLREQAVVVHKRKVTDEEAAAMAKEYEAGATMAEIEAKYKLSHGAVYRALHRVGLETRPSAPRSKQE